MIGALFSKKDIDTLSVPGGIDAPVKEYVPHPPMVNMSKAAMIRISFGR